MDIYSNFAYQMLPLLIIGLGLFGVKFLLDYLYRPKKEEWKVKIHFIESDNLYLCNKACSTTKQKSTQDTQKVTCKNCINIIRRNELG